MDVVNDHQVEVAEKSLAETKAKAGEEARIKEELQKRVKELEDEVGLDRR